MGRDLGCRVSLDELNLYPFVLEELGLKEGMLLLETQRAPQSVRCRSEKDGLGYL